MEKKLSERYRQQIAILKAGLKALKKIEELNEELAYDGDPDPDGILVNTKSGLEAAVGAAETTMLMVEEFEE